MTAITERIDTSSITAQARAVRFLPTMLALIAFLLIGAGKLAYRTIGLIWLAGAWTFCAVRQGWREAKLADEAKRRAARRAG